MLGRLCGDSDPSLEVSGVQWCVNPILISQQHSFPQGGRVSVWDCVSQNYTQLIYSKMGL